MKNNLQTILESELDSIRGGMFKSQGWKGGSVEFANGNSVSVTPFSTGIELTSDNANKLSGTLNLVSATALGCPGLMGATAIASAMINKMNEGGKGVTIHVPHGIPSTFITPRK